MRSNRVIDATLKNKKLEGFEPSVKHKEEICQEDSERLDRHFNDVLTSDDPVRLTMFV